MDSLIGLDFSD